MPISMRLHIVLALTVVQALGCRHPAEPGSIDHKFGAFHRADRAAFAMPDRARAAAVGRAYDHAFASDVSTERLAVMRAHDLELVYRAAHMAAFHTLDERHIRDMQAALGALQHRALATAEHYAKLHRVLIEARRLPEASAFAAKHPALDLEPIPVLHEAPDIQPGSPTEWVVDPHNDELLRRSVELKRPAQVLVVSHPLCHPSSRAMRDILADPVLSSLFRAHAKWLAPQADSLNIAQIQRWNRDHPGQETTLAYQRDEWPMIDRWSTPTFYFFEHGVVRYKVEGWPKAGRRAELLAGLRRIGLVE